MTQAEVADAISVTRQTISSYETGRTKPDLETLKRLAEVYKADLTDVLYGGNRLQRRLKQIKLVAIILSAIMLLGFLIHSAMLLTLNNLFPPGTTDYNTIIDKRFPLLHIAVTAAGIGKAIFSVGGIIMLYPSIAVIHAVSFRKLFLFFLVQIIAMFACAVPFGMTDEIFGLADYLFPLWNGLVYVLLFFLVTLSAKLIKRRRS